MRLDLKQLPLGPRGLAPRRGARTGPSVEPVKVMYCIDAIDRGGTESQLAGLINRLDRREFAPRLCTLRPSSSLLSEIDCPKLELDVRRLMSSSALAKMQRLAALLREERVGIVQTFFQDSTVFGLAAARLATVPVRVVAFRDLGFWRTPSREFLMRSVYPWATGFLANSLAVRDQACAADRLAPERVRVIHNGIDSRMYPFVDHPEGEIAIGIVGNLNRRVKRADLFLRAAARLARRWPGVTFHLIGDGELRPEYEALAGSLGLSSRVRFAGRIADVPAYLRTLAVGVICSDSEGLSNALLEYMLSGCAVVATAVGGNVEVVRHGETGLLVPPDDEVALAAALEIVVGNAELRSALARGARAAVEAQFSWTRCVEDHQEHYRSLLSAACAV